MHLRDVEAHAKSLQPTKRALPVARAVNVRAYRREALVAAPFRQLKLSLDLADGVCAGLHGRDLERSWTRGHRVKPGRGLEERLDTRDQVAAVYGQRTRSGLLAAVGVRQGVPAVEGISLRRGGDKTNLGAGFERGVTGRRASDPLRGGPHAAPGLPIFVECSLVHDPDGEDLRGCVAGGLRRRRCRGEAQHDQDSGREGEAFRPWGGHSHRFLFSTASFAHPESAVKSFKSEPQGAMQALRPQGTDRCRPGGSDRAGGRADP